MTINHLDPVSKVLVVGLTAILLGFSILLMQVPIKEYTVYDGLVLLGTIVGIVGIYYPKEKKDADRVA